MQADGLQFGNPLPTKSKFQFLSLHERLEDLLELLQGVGTISSSFLLLRRRIHVVLQTVRRDQNVVRYLNHARLCNAVRYDFAVASAAHTRRTRREKRTDGCQAVDAEAQEALEPGDVDRQVLALQQGGQVDVRVTVVEATGIVQLVLAARRAGQLERVRVQVVVGRDVVLDQRAQVRVAARREQEGVDPDAQLLPVAVRRRKDGQPLSTQLGQLVNQAGAVQCRLGCRELGRQGADQVQDRWRREEDRIDRVDDAVVCVLLAQSIPQQSSRRGEEGRGELAYNVEHGELAVKVEPQAVAVQADAQTLVHVLAQIVVRQTGHERVVVAQVLGRVHAGRNVVEQHLVDQLLGQVVVLEPVQQLKGAVAGHKHRVVVLFVTEDVDDVLVVLDQLVEAAGVPRLGDQVPHGRVAVRACVILWRHVGLAEGRGVVGAAMAGRAAINTADADCCQSTKSGPLNSIAHRPKGSGSEWCLPP